jgi:hypothetical protein
MDAAADRDGAGKENGPTDDEKAKRHEGIADMQNEDEPVAQGPITRPPSQPDSLDDRREEQERPRRRPSGSEDPKGKGRSRSRQHPAIKAAKRLRKPPGVFTRQPIAGEAWNDTPADQRNQ